MGCCAITNGGLFWNLLVAYFARHASCTSLGNASSNCGLDNHPTKGAQSHLINRRRIVHARRIVHNLVLGVIRLEKSRDGYVYTLANRLPCGLYYSQRFMSGTR